jgi:hypothetical protein
MLRAWLCTFCKPNRLVDFRIQGWLCCLAEASHREKLMQRLWCCENCIEKFCKGCFAAGHTPATGKANAGFFFLRDKKCIEKSCKGCFAAGLSPATGKANAEIVVLYETFREVFKGCFAAGQTQPLEMLRQRL